MPEVTQIQVKNTVYDIRDAQARERLIPAGGVAGAALIKASNDSFDTKWASISIPEYTVTTESIGSASAGTAISADDITGWNAGAVPTLGTAIPADDITDWSAGTLPAAVVNGENLTLTFGTLPSLSYTAKSIPNVTSVGTAPTLQYTARTIPNITVTSKTVVTSVTENT